QRPLPGLCQDRARQGSRRGQGQHVVRALSAAQGRVGRGDRCSGALSRLRPVASAERDRAPGDGRPHAGDAMREERAGRAPELSVPTEGVATLRISWDDDPYFTWTLDDLARSLEPLHSDETIRVVVVEGSERRFSFGLPRERFLAADAAETIPALAAGLPPLLLGAPVPLVAAMAGHAPRRGLLLGRSCALPV